MIIDHLKFIFLLPSKTGSSSLRSLFFSFDFKKRPDFRRLNFPHYHLTISEIAYVYGLDSGNLKRYKKIQIVRNPISRFVSAWKHQERILGDKIQIDDLLEKLLRFKSLLPHQWEEFYLKFYEDPQHKEKSFEKGNWGGLRFYMDQVDWNDLNLDVHYFKLEDLSNDITPLADLLQLPLQPLPMVNIGKYNFEGNSSLTSTQKELIFKLFEKDFKKFDYGF